jgi:alkylation response protein AidB-like acyl-CoA dehydrogenase
VLNIRERGSGMSVNWKLDKEGIDILAKVDRIAREQISEAAPENDSLGRYPDETLALLKSENLTGLISDANIGGKGKGLREALAVSHRIAQECPSTAMVLIMHYCGSAVIEKYGTEEAREQIAKHGKITTLAFSESGSRSHFWVPVGTAERCSEGVKLNAAKQLITSAGKADYYVWSSKPTLSDGLSSIWLVPSDSQGLEIPTKYDGLGLRANSSAPILANDVLISDCNLLGKDGDGFNVMMETVMPFFSLQNCAVSVGSMEGALRRAVEHVTSSRYSYDESALCDIPQVRSHIAKMRLKIDLVAGFLLDALDAIELQREDAMLRVLQAKLAGAETSLEVHDLAMRVCGGAAFRKDNGVERFFRDSRAAVVMAPVSDALYDFIGKAVCGMPVF